MSNLQDDFTTAEEPLVNIGAVSRLTGISDTTLRVWERRYGFPQPARTSGGHRLYSRHEVSRLRWVKAQVEAGVQVSRAIRALLETEHGKWGEGLQAPTENDSTVERFLQRLIAALLTHDSERANRVIGEALALIPLETVVLDLISPTLNSIGQAWEAGRIDVTTEHFASHYLRHQLLAWLRVGAAPLRVNPVLLACAPGELHEGSLLMLAILLQQRRLPFIYLGQDVPLSDFTTFASDVRAAMIIFTAMMKQSALALRELPNFLPSALPEKMIVAYGGRAFLQYPELKAEMPGVYLGDTLREGVLTVERLLRSSNPPLFL